MIVTFYSYKGGVGRSMALANVAQWFRLQGLRVLVVDWDLEAPGLESFFAADSAEREAIAGKVGLIDLIASYRDMFPNLPLPQREEQCSGEVKTNRKCEFGEVLRHSLPPLRHFLFPIKPQAAQAASRGSLALLPAGCRTGDRFNAYAETVQEFNWADLYANYRGEAYFEWMRSQLDDPEVADIVLIDTRTGVSEMSGVCTRQLADVVVVLCAPNDQNLDGVEKMARSFVREEVLKARGGRPIQLVFVPARVDVTEGHVVDRFESELQDRLQDYMPWQFGALRSDYRRLRIPYVSVYAFSERLAVGDAQGAIALQDAYGMLAMHIAAMAPQTSDLRLKCVPAMQKEFKSEELAALFDTPIVRNNEQVMRLNQLKEALRLRVIDQSTFDTAVSAISGRFANSGATAQGAGAVALGSGAVYVGGKNAGSINTGTQTNIATGGGAFVAGPVQVGNGYYIAGNLVQIVSQGTSDDPEEATSVIALYLQALAADLAGLKLGEIDTSTDQTRQSPLQLADIYVPLATTLRIPEGTTLAQWLARDRSPEREAGKAERETRPVSALDVLATHRELTLLGKPGSGKSTFGASVLLRLAQAWQGQADQLATLGAEWTHGALLPIRVILRRFAEQLQRGDQPARARDLWDFIARDLDASGYGLSDDASKHVRRLASTHGALILFDGLDECGDSARRERVMAGVKELMQNAGPKCRFVLTARPYALPAGPDPERGVYALADLDDGQIERFIRAWYAALVRRNWRSPGEAERKMDDLMQARQRPDLLPLAQNPLLLTLMATLHTNRGRLPDDRADLYDESVDLLMLRWNRQIGADKALLDELDVPGLKLSDLREVLEELAFQIHARNVGREGAADIGEDQMVRAFVPLLKSKDKANLVVHFIEKRAGLLLGQGEKHGERQFTFPHRTFQEFLAACHLAAHPDFPAECARLARAAAAHWQVVLALAARLAKAERGASAADELIGGRSVAELRLKRRPAAADWTCAALAGRQLLEIGAGAINKGERTRAIAARVAEWIAASLPAHPGEGGLAARQRAEAGDLLAALGDPRFDAQRFHLPAEEMLGFVPVPADPEFRIGTRNKDAKRVAKIVESEAQDDEINDAPTPTPAFHIARYPVTVAQFRAFVEATDFKIGDGDALRGPDNRPVRWVNWHEALAYCGWLNGLLAASPVLAGSPVSRLVREQRGRVTLPSELEWEKAARGGLPDAVFSWGDEPDPERANYDDSGIGNTSAVGCFPANGFELNDMIGNVWEWTCSLWGEDWLEPEFRYPYVPDATIREDPSAGDDVLRVVRGGSWGSSPADARCAARGRGPPVDRSRGIGFRVVLRSAPVR